ncbi:MAG: PPC domain-containing DNA-binding protein [Candidatus Paceibacterota bacterium]
MKYTRDKDIYVIRIDRGEEVIDSLVNFCLEEGIDNAVFSGIGAVSSLSCGYYNLEEKKYYFSQYETMLEAVSLTGNVALKEGRPFVHVHGVFTGTDNQAFGGHIEKMTAGVVVELVLQKLSTSIRRELEEDIGLALLTCGE